MKKIIQKIKEAIIHNLEVYKIKRIERLKKEALDRVVTLKDKGKLIGNTPEGVALKLYEKDFNSYIDCIFTTVGGRIYAQDNIVKGNRFKVKMQSGRYSIWSILTKTTEQWKWDTCHTVTGIYVGDTANG